MRAFLETGGFKGFTTTFEDLHGLGQLPGLAVQRLMADGYGFGAEGDWKTAALVRAMKVMASGLPGGTSFMEDYTYHLDPKGDEGARRAHAGDLPLDRRRASRRWRSTRSASAARPTRCAWCSTSPPGPALNASMIDLGNRFRLIVNEVDVVTPDAAAAEAAGGARRLGAAART